MSENRFITKGLVEGVPAIWCDDEVMEQEDVAQLLNEQQATINQLKEELKLEQDFTSRWQKESEMLAKENERLKQKIQRWKTLYEIKDKEVTARVDALNKVCEYYTSEVLFKSDVDPNKAVKEVINEILNTEVENDE